MRLYPPGTRKGNRFYVARGSIAGESIELSTKTADFAEAQRIAADMEAVILAEARIAGRLKVAVDLLTISGEEIRRLPASGEVGIYFLIEGEALNYVGQSARVSVRLTQHLETKRIPFDACRVLACNATELDLYEAAYIYRYKPPYNRGVRGRAKLELVT